MNNYFIMSDAELTAKGFKDYLEDLEWFDDLTLGVKIQDVIEKINDQYNVEDFCGYPGGLRKLGKKAGILRKGLPNFTKTLTRPMPRRSLQRS